MKEKETGMQRLMVVFEGAMKEAVGAREPHFVFISVDVGGVKEVITIPEESFYDKRLFYMSAYTDKLVHVMNDRVKITGARHGSLAMIKLVMADL